MLRAVFFDLDDTLCDTISCRRERIRTTLRMVAARYPALNVDGAVARAMEPLPEPRTVRGLCAVLDELDVRDRKLIEQASLAFDTEFAPLQLFPGVLETLKLLALRYTLGVVSNAGPYQRTKLEHLGLAPLFNAVALCGELGVEKPDPRIFRYALRLAGVRAADAVFVGDLLDVDIDGAQAAGLHTVWFNCCGVQPGGGDYQPNAVISHYAEFPTALKRCGVKRWVVLPDPANVAAPHGSLPNVDS